MRMAVLVRWYRSLPDDEQYQSEAIMPGEPTAITGEICVHSQPSSFNKFAESLQSKTAAYLWRITYPGRTNAIDFDKRIPIKQGRRTAHTGIEWGEFTINTERGEVRVNPDWIVDNHICTNLSDVVVSGTNGSFKFRIPTWSSPLLDLTAEVEEWELDEIKSTIKDITVNSTDNHFLETKELREGDTVTVCGTIHNKDGERIIHGADTTPMIISDSGLHDTRKKIRAKITVHALALAFLLFMIRVVLL